MSRRKKLKSELPIQETDSQHVAIGKDVVVETKKSLPVHEASSIFNLEGELVVDVFETDSEFVVLTAIAGVKIEDLDIAVEKDMMIIKGQRVNPNENPDKKYFYQECYWGPFSKKIVLPENIDTASTEAQINKGVLTIKIPKINDKNSANGEKAKEVELS